MPAFSLRALLFATSMVAFSLVILGRPSLFWTRLTLTATLATLGWWLVMALVCSSARRRFGIGAATIGIGYLLIAFHTPPAADIPNGGYTLGRTLLTHKILEDASKIVDAEYPTKQPIFVLWDRQLFREGNYGSGSQPKIARGASAYARYQCYLISGHCLFALLCGLIAGSAAKRWLKPEEDESRNGGPR